MMINSTMYNGKKIAIAGYGLEGESALKYFQARGAEVTILDQADVLARAAPQGVEVRLGENAFDDLAGFDLVSRTPPLNPSKLTHAREVTSVTREFFKQCPASIIGVTGTKGKGTTTTLAYEILRAAGKTVHLVGNVGNPALNDIDDINSEDIVCYEISSFQLWDMKQSPSTAVVLMIAPDHLNIHADMAEYIDAKKNITRWQQPEDVAIHHPSNEMSAEIAEAGEGRRVRYLSSDAAHIDDENIVIDGQVICAVSEVGLRGAHNLENICAAVSAAWQYSQDVDAFKRAIKAFTGLEHRIEFLREFEGVKYVNDAYSSAPLATEAAIKAFPDDTIVLMLGGKEKNGDYSPALDAIIEHGNIRSVILFGENRNTLAASLSSRGFEDTVSVEGDLTELVSAAQSVAQNGDVALFSPGTSSYDMFKNFKQRGETFKSVIGSLGE